MLLLIQYVTRFPACVVTGHGPAADGPEAVEAADGPEDAVDAVDVLQVPPGGRAGRDHEAELPPVSRRHQCSVNTIFIHVGIKMKPKHNINNLT